MVLFVLLLVNLPTLIVGSLCQPPEVGIYPVPPLLGVFSLEAHALNNALVDAVFNSAFKLLPKLKHIGSLLRTLKMVVVDALNQGLAVFHDVIKPHPVEE